jgi:ACT domain-containing protein
MIVSMDLELKDIPGQLVLALKPISDFGGNIRSVIHHRAKRTPRNTIPVQVTFEVDEDKLKSILYVLGSNGVTVARLGEQRMHENVLVILIGHVVRSDIRNTIDAIDRTGFAEVVDLDMSMPGIGEHSSASLRINATGKKELQAALKILEEIAKKKNLLLITPIDAEAPPERSQPTGGGV